MTLRFSSDVKLRNALTSPPPPGATFASFVLFSALAALLAMIYAGGEWWSLGGGFGFSSDAGWTRAVFARNVISGHGLSFNPGSPVAGAPAPVWVMLLALAGCAGGYLFAAKALGVACVILTSFLVWRITLDLVGDWRFAFLAGLLVVASPRLMAGALAGTEGALAALLLAAAVYWQGIGWEGIGRQRIAAGMAAGLAALSRPELILLPALMLVDRWLASVWHAPPAGPPRRVLGALARSLPEVLLAALVVAPYVLHNWQVGRLLWPQPEVALRAQGGWAWALTASRALWEGNPLALCAAVLGLPVAALMAGRTGARHPSFVLVMAPLLFIGAPGFIWRYSSPEPPVLAATYLVPVISVLAAAGLFLVHRALGQVVARSASKLARFGFGMGIALTLLGLAALSWFAHREAWLQHGALVKRIDHLTGYIGRWAADHTAPDASIASREIGAMGYFSRRRMVDLGGAIEREGLTYLRRPGAFDSNVLAYLEEVKPSYLAIRGVEIPDLSQRIDLLTPAVTSVEQDALTGGVITWVLYETVWPPPSVRTARGEAQAEERHRAR
jgi:hypothetical protein